MKKKLRKKNKKYINVHLYFTILVLADFLIIVLFAIGISNFLRSVVGIKLAVSPVVALIASCSGVAGGITLILSRIFLNPFRELSESMQRVEEGNFEIRLDTESRLYEVRKTYDSFNKMMEQLAVTEVIQKDFISNVSHEFKTPLSAIEGYAMLMQTAALSDEDKELYTEKILYNTRRLSDLVGNILLLSKFENQTLSVHSENFKLDEQIRQAVLSLETEWDKRAVEFELELEEVIYYGNESMLMHVWTNLIGNAIKFGPDGQTITIRLVEQEEKIVFTVEDQGPGIMTDVKHNIYEKFYQEDSSHKGDGNGLGLALVKKIVELNAGEVSVENIEPTGCRFIVVLPVKVDETVPLWKAN